MIKFIPVIIGLIVAIVFTLINLNYDRSMFNIKKERWKDCKKIIEETKDVDETETNFTKNILRPSSRYIQRRSAFSKINELEINSLGNDTYGIIDYTKSFLYTIDKSKYVCLFILIFSIVTILFYGVMIDDINPYFKLNRYEREYSREHDWNRENIKSYLSKKDRYKKTYENNKIYEILKIEVE